MEMTLAQLKDMLKACRRNNGSGRYVGIFGGL